MADNKLVAYSFSRLDAYETCPRKYWHQSVEKDIKELPNDAQVFGDAAHKAFKLYFQAGQSLPLHLRQYEQYLKPISMAPGDKICEQEIALNTSYRQVEWYAKDAYIRVKSDLTIHNGVNAICFDWKFGKPHKKFDQLKLTAAVTFLLGPEIERITMAYFWAKTKEVDSKVMTREEAPSFWAELQPRVQQYQEAHWNKEFPPKPNFLCKGFCPVTAANSTNEEETDDEIQHWRRPMDRRIVRLHCYHSYLVCNTHA